MAEDGTQGSLRFTSLPLRKLRVVRLTVGMTREERFWQGMDKGDRVNSICMDWSPFKELSDGAAESRSCVACGEGKDFCRSGQEAIVRMWFSRKTSGADPSHSPAHQGSPIEVRDDNFWDRHCRELCRVLLFETSLVCHAAGIAALVPRCQLHLLYGENSLMRHGTGMPHRGPSALPHFPTVVRLTVGMTMEERIGRNNVSPALTSNW